MFHVKDDFNNRFRVPRDWFNSIGAFANNITQGYGIHLDRPDRPGPGNPVLIEVDPEGIENLGFARTPMYEDDAPDSARAAMAPLDVVEYNADETVAQKAERAGTSKLAAPLDHVHMLPDSVYTTDDFDIEDYYTADDVDTLLEYYYTADDVDAMLAAMLEDADLDLTGILTASDVGTTVAAQNHTHNLSSFSVPDCNNLCFLLSDHGTIIHSNSNPSVEDVQDIIEAYADGVILTTADFDPADYYTANDVDALMDDFLDVGDIGTTVAEATHTHTVSEISDFPSTSANGTLNLWVNGEVWDDGAVTVYPCQLSFSHGLITAFNVGNRIRVI